MAHRKAYRYTIIALSVLGLVACGWMASGDTDPAASPRPMVTVAPPTPSPTPTVNAQDIVACKAVIDLYLAPDTDAGSTIGPDQVKAACANVDPAVYQKMLAESSDAALDEIIEDATSELED